jgi:SAM-dependent methyltransferase
VTTQHPASPADEPGSRQPSGPNLAWVPAHIDLNAPSPARIYDYFLGGSHNFAVDRQVAKAFIKAVPDTARLAQDNRAFLQRAVRYLVDVAGVRQLLDLGSGMPTVGNVHTTAQKSAPDARVLYVDIDPVAVAHSQAILEGNDRADALEADLRDPHILNHPRLHRLLDLDRPVAVLLVSVLHFVSESDDPDALLARLRAALAPGSYLVISHFTAESRPDIGRYERVGRDAGIEGTLRNRAQIERMFAGFELVEPGLVSAPLWRPDRGENPDGEQPAAILAGVGRKP